MVLYKSSTVQLKQQTQQVSSVDTTGICVLLVKLSIILGNKSLSFANLAPSPPLSFNL